MFRILATNEKATRRQPALIILEEKFLENCSHHYLNYKAIAVKVCLTFKLRTGLLPISIPGKEALNRSCEAKL
jgi:hypothetical protein